MNTFLWNLAADESNHPHVSEGRSNLSDNSAHATRNADSDTALLAAKCLISPRLVQDYSG